jgi:ABC-type taurine transport system substrate-binding protein
MEEIVPVVRADIQGALAKGSVIVDGVMMRTIIAAASVDVDVHVYVVPSQANKRRAFWEGILSKPLDAYLAELKDINDKQTVKYHWSTHPVVNADFIVEGA